MRKFLIILLLAWLPTQFASAAVSVYCEHEQAQSGDFAHPGHHEHEHPTPVDPGTPADSGAAHPDCSVCHTATTLPALAAWMDMTTTAMSLPSFISAAFPVPPPGAPDRPNWRSA